MTQDNSGLVYVGKIVQVQDIHDAEHIASATVVCGSGGKWKGVIRKKEFAETDKCIVYLPDAVIPKSDDMAFMASRGWRIKMCRFRGAPSEVLIMRTDSNLPVGTDITKFCGVTKFAKPIPSNLQGVAAGDFPSFIPKTDEINYQRNPQLVEALHGKPYYITEKADGTSTTGFKYNGQFGVCSRNYQLLPDDNNGYWQVATRYKLEQRLPEGYALQWETCGPKIQENPMGLSELDGFAFSAYDIVNRKYLEMRELFALCKEISFPTVQILREDRAFNMSEVETLGQGKYKNGGEREGVVVRSQMNIGFAPISFKVINLNYEK